MCIPHGANATISNGYVKEKRTRKPLKKVSQELFEHGDPDFVDERKQQTPPKKTSWIETLLKWA